MFALTLIVEVKLRLTFNITSALYTGLSMGLDKYEIVKRRFPPYEPICNIILIFSMKIK